MVAMGADELAAAFHAPGATRSELSNIWNDALRDNDDPMQHDAGSSAVAVSPSSSSNASSASSPSMPPQSQAHSQLLMPPGAGFFYSTATANANLGDLSAFLATSMAPPVPQATVAAVASVNVVGTNHSSSAAASSLSGSTTSLGTNFLDDLLSSTDDMDFRVRGTAGGAQAPSTNNFMHMTSLPPSIQQTLHVQRQLGAAPAFGSLSDAPFLGMDAAAGESGALSSTTASRLLQLENNYERKKKRAKINRKDLNARFQELMDILNLKEDRKLNRAKVLEKTIEYIEKLEDELHALRTRGDATSAAPSVTPTPAFASAPVQSASVLLANARSGHSIGNGASLMAFDPASAHAWSAAAAAAAAGASSLPMAPMMWLPCPMVPPPPPSAAAVGSSSGSAGRSAAPPAVRGQLSKRLGTRTAGASSSSSTVVPADEAPSDSSTRRSLKRARDSSRVSAVAVARSAPGARIVTTSESLFVWSAHEIPTLLAFCDAWTLVRVMETSKELAVVAKQNALWVALSRRRWRLSQPLEWPDAREQWTRLHREMHMPACGTVSSSGIRFASGRAQGVHVWGLLARRSNGRTTRTVLLSGKPTVMQVVELHVVLQNMGQRTVRLTDDIAVRADASSSSCFAPFGLSSGAHLTPHVLSVNDNACATKDLASVALHHGDVCVLGVFLQCPGLDLEQEFLQRASCLDVQCAVVAAGSGARVAADPVAVRAQCLDDARKKQLLDAHYSSLDEAV